MVTIPVYEFIRCRTVSKVMFECALYQIIGIQSTSSQNMEVIQYFHLSGSPVHVFMTAMLRCHGPPWLKHPINLA